MVMDVINMHRQHKHEKVVVSKRKKNSSRVMLAVKECDEQVYFLMLVNDSTLLKKKGVCFWKHYQGE